MESVSSLMSELNSSQRGKLLPSSFPLRTILSFALQLNNSARSCVLSPGMGEQFYFCGDTNLPGLRSVCRVSVPSASSNTEGELDASRSFPALQRREVDGADCSGRCASCLTFLGLSFLVCTVGVVRVTVVLIRSVVSSYI